jgi:hypothetical protein
MCAMRSARLRALLMVGGSALVGTAYFIYLNAEPFPPAIVRFVPLAWLAGSVHGALLAGIALKRDSRKGSAGMALVLSIPNVTLAVLFSVAALMGD